MKFRLSETLKNLICALLIICVIAFFTACSDSSGERTVNLPDSSETEASGTESAGQNSELDENSGKTILCADFAEYDWCRNIIGDNPGSLNLQLLNETGMDMHSFQPSVQDMIKIYDCDLLIYVGGISEFWVNDSLGAGTGPRGEAMSLMVEYCGEEAEHHHHHDADDDDHDHDADEDDDHDAEGHDDHDHDADGHHEDETDEHIWLSPVIAKQLVEAITEKLCEIDAANSEYYLENSRQYVEKLDELNKAYQEMASSSEDKTVLFCDRYPFSHLMEDYGISAYAAFPGCEAEVEASFNTIIRLADVIDELDISTVLILEGSDGSLAETVAGASEKGADSEISVSVMNSMQSIGRDEMENGASYLDIMYSNLETLRQALN